MEEVGLAILSLFVTIGTILYLKYIAKVPPISKKAILLTGMIGGSISFLATLIFAIGLAVTKGENDLFGFGTIFSVLILLVFIVIFIWGKVMKDENNIYSDKIIKEQRERYATMPYVPIDDYQKELAFVREQFEKDTSSFKNLVQTNGREFWKILSDRTAINAGKVCYGYLIQANTQLFTSKNKYLALPATIVYSHDEYYEKKPLELQKIAYALFENRDNNGLGNETEYKIRIPVPQEICEGREVYFSSVLIDRHQLPFGFLTSGLMPVIAHTQKETSIFVVDCKYWSNALITNFIRDENFDKFCEYRFKLFANLPKPDEIDYLKELDFIQEKVDEIVNEENANDDDFNLFQQSVYQTFYACAIDLKGHFSKPYNKSVQEPIPITCIFCEDDEFKRNPKKLLQVSQEVKKNKRFVRAMRSIVNEKELTIAPFDFCPNDDSSHVFTATAIMVHPLDLPQLYCSSSVLPVIKVTKNENDWSIFSADYEFWSQTLLSDFVNGENKL